MIDYLKDKLAQAGKPLRVYVVFAEAGYKAPMPFIMTAVDECGVVLAMAGTNPNVETAYPWARIGRLAPDVDRSAA